ncbi:HNH endonuclease [Deinococcus sp. Leaf326]|uniref:HNH endonuclease n=1 Tax=Deinococcus sp. Leaf326 TaxID=1736338 RepID=UPI0009EA70AC|nr:HNH endonuclease [Deinococcus sp. Leaf326]
MRRRKRYAQVRCNVTGKWVALHRQLMAEYLGRPLLPGEIVHHRDGDSTNNDPSNLMVLPSQRYHAHVEYHLRCERRGMPALFPEYFPGVREVSLVREPQRGTLFEHVLLSGPSIRRQS